MELPITNEFELFEELRKLVNRAEQGGLTTPHLTSLRTIGEQIMSAILDAHHQNKTAAHYHEDRRESFRFQPQDSAYAVVESERIPVRVLDLGGRGMGLLSPTAIDSGIYLLLEITGAEGTDVYSCFTAFCREKDGGFRVGLRVFAKLPQ